MSVRTLEAFIPVRVSPNTELTNEGIRLIGFVGKLGERVLVTSPEDVRAILPLMQTRIVAAVAEVLPEPVADSIEPWAIVNDCLFRFSRGESISETIEKAVPFLFACRLLMRERPQNDDQRVLAVFVDRFLPFARGESLSSFLPRRTPTISDLYRDLNEDEGGADADYVKPTSLPWPGTLGANLAPFDSVGEALDFFGYGDFLIEGDRIKIPVGRHGGKMDVEISMSSVGLLDARELVSQARVSIGQSSADSVTLGGDIVGSHACAVTSGKDRFRVHVDRLPDGVAYWAFRRLYIPKATKLNFGFDVT
jgi:hypothetical protein